MSRKQTAMKVLASFYITSQAIFPPSAFAEKIGPLGLEVGTGGSATIRYVQLRGDRGYPFAPYEWNRRIAEYALATTAAEKVSQIRAVLITKATDLAAVLGVSRQAIYDWQAGKPITAQNAARLEELSKAADLLSVEGVRGTSQTLRRPIRNGKTFLDLIRAGDSAESAARGLIQIVRAENTQRALLQKRFAGRKRPPKEAFERIGNPVLNEEAR
jgi:hypothetical protein